MSLMPRAINASMSVDIDLECAGIRRQPPKPMTSREAIWGLLGPSVVEATWTDSGQPQPSGEAHLLLLCLIYLVCKMEAVNALHFTK